MVGGGGGGGGVREAEQRKEDEEEEGKGPEVKTRHDSDMTDFDYSTDDESIRLFFSETDQSEICSEISTRRSSYGSHNDVSDKLGMGEGSRPRSTEDLRQRIKSHRRLLLQHQSVSLDYTESGS